MKDEQSAHSQPGRWSEIRATTWLVLREAVGSFIRNQNLEHSATLAYYGSLSLMPLLLLVIYLLGFVMQSSEAVQESIQRVMTQIFPSFSGAILADLMRLSRDRTWGVVTFIVLMWSVTPFAAAIRQTLNEIFHVERRMNLLLSKLMDLVAVLAVLVLFVVLAGSRVIFSGRFGQWLALLMPLFEFFRSLLTFAFTILILGFFFRVFSSVRFRWTHLLAGALTTTLLLWLIRPLFGLVLRFNPDYGYVFGSLKAIFLLIIWVYYTFAVVLFGAEIMAAIRRRHALLLGRLLSGKGWKKGGAQRLLARFTRQVEEGGVVFEDGAPGQEMFYVLSGEVSILVKGQLLKRLGPGGYFGEMSMLLKSPRTAAAVASAPDTRIVAISEEYFQTIMRDNPEIVQRLLVEMAERLRATNAKLSSG